MGQNIQEWTSKTCGRQPLKNDMFCFNRPYHFKLFKGCLPKILLGPFVNIWFQMRIVCDLFLQLPWKRLQSLRHLLFIISNSQLYSYDCIKVIFIKKPSIPALAILREFDAVSIGLPRNSKLTSKFSVFSYYLPVSWNNTVVQENV